MPILKTLSENQKLIFLLILLIVGQLGLTAVTREITDMKTDFLDGKVQIIDFNYEITRFRIVENNAVVDVRNDIHLRLVDDPYNLPEVFPIIAPITAVDVVEGAIPSNYIQKYTLKHYLALKQKYEASAQPFPASPATEKIIRKDDADYIFGLRLGEWEDYATRMVHPSGWKVQLSPHDTGTQVMAFAPSTGIGLSVQPLYDSNDRPPSILIVGSYYPIGSLPTFTEDFKKNLESDAAKDLGPAYSVSASYTKMPPFEGIELAVTKK